VCGQPECASCETHDIHSDGGRVSTPRLPLPRISAQRHDTVTSADGEV
jgi:hypothetical protein